MDSRPIGIFDSGVGGLSVWKEVQRILPHESTLYFADSAHCPYGSKPPDEITRLSRTVVDFLLSKNCKLIIVACNTATSAAIRTLRELYKIPIVGMEPALKPAALRTRTGHIGVLATEGTLKGEKFHSLKQKFARNVEVHVRVGQGLVELVEQGLENSPQARDLLWSYVGPMLECQVDQIVLGCTHYPFLTPLIESLVGTRASIHDPAPAVARRAASLLHESTLAAPPETAPAYDFFTNGDAEQLQRMIALASGGRVALLSLGVESGHAVCHYVPSHS